MSAIAEVETRLAELANHVGTVISADLPRWKAEAATVAEAAAPSIEAALAGLGLPAFLVGVLSNGIHALAADASVHAAAATEQQHAANVDQAPAIAASVIGQAVAAATPYTP